MSKSDEKSDGIQTEQAKRYEEDDKRFGPGWDPSPPPADTRLRDATIEKHDRAFSTGWSVVKGCSCKPGIERDNCPQCEGTGNPINFTTLYHTCPKCGKRGDGIKYKHKKYGCSGVKMSDNEDDDRWRSNIEASEPMALNTGWAVVKSARRCDCSLCGNPLGVYDHLTGNWAHYECVDEHDEDVKTWQGENV